MTTEKTVRFYIRYRNNLLNEEGEFKANLPMRGAKPFASEEEAAIHAQSLSLPEGQYDIIRRGGREREQND